MGWPSLIAALMLASAGTWLRKPAPIWIGLVLILPVALYLSGSPAYPFAGIAPIAALVLAAVTCRLPGRWPSLAGVGVYLVFLLALAYVATDQTQGSGA